MNYQLLFISLFFTHCSLVAMESEEKSETEDEGFETIIQPFQNIPPEFEDFTVTVNSKQLEQRLDELRKSETGTSEHIAENLRQLSLVSRCKKTLIRANTHIMNTHPQWKATVDVSDLYIAILADALKMRRFQKYCKHLRKEKKSTEKQTVDSSVKKHHRRNNK